MGRKFIIPADTFTGTYADRVVAQFRGGAVGIGHAGQELTFWPQGYDVANRTPNLAQVGLVDPVDLWRQTSLGGGSPAGFLASLALSPDEGVASVARLDVDQVDAASSGDNVRGSWQLTPSGPGSRVYTLLEPGDALRTVWATPPAVGGGQLLVDCIPLQSTAEVIQTRSLLGIDGSTQGVNLGGQARILSNLGGQVTTIAGAGAYVAVGDSNAAHPAYSAIGASNGIVLAGGPAAEDQFLEYQLPFASRVLVRAVISLLTTNVAAQTLGFRITQSTNGGAFATLPTSGAGLFVEGKPSGGALPGEVCVLEQIVNADPVDGATPGSRWRVEVENVAAVDDVIVGSVSLLAEVLGD